MMALMASTSVAITPPKNEPGSNPPKMPPSPMLVGARWRYRANAAQGVHFRLYVLLDALLRVVAGSVAQRKRSMRAHGERHHLAVVRCQRRDVEAGDILHAGDLH